MPSLEAGSSPLIWKCRVVISSCWQKSDHKLDWPLTTSSCAWLSAREEKGGGGRGGRGEFIQGRGGFRIRVVQPEAELRK